MNLATAIKTGTEFTRKGHKWFYYDDAVNEIKESDTGKIVKFSTASWLKEDWKITTKSDDGYKRKFIIKKANGNNIDPNAEYFVLRLDNHGKDIRFARACRKAALTLSDEIKDYMPQLSEDLKTIVTYYDVRDDEGK